MQLATQQSRMNLRGLARQIVVRPFPQIATGVHHPVPSIWLLFFRRGGHAGFLQFLRNVLPRFQGGGEGAVESRIILAERKTPKKGAQFVTFVARLLQTPNT